MSDMSPESEAAWYVVFDLSPDPLVTASSLITSPILNEVLAATIDIDPGVRMLLRVGGDSETAIGKAVAFAWSVIEVECQNADILQLYISDGSGNSIDCTDRLRELEAVREQFR